MNLPIQISSEALAQIKYIFENQISDKSYALRIGIRGNGCSGTNFILGFDRVSESDKLFELDNIKIIIDKKHFLYLIGMRLDYINTDEAKGFAFNSI